MTMIFLPPPPPIFFLSQLSAWNIFPPGDLLSTIFLPPPFISSGDSLARIFFPVGQFCLGYLPPPLIYFLGDSLPRLSFLGKGGGGEISEAKVPTLEKYPKQNVHLSN